MTDRALPHLRRRVVVLAAAVVALALGAGASVTVAVVRARGVDALDEEIERRLGDVRGQIESDQLAATIPVFGDPQAVVAQVVRRNRVVAATANAQDLPPFDRACTDTGATISIESVDQGSFRIGTTCVTVGPDRYVVHVAVNRDDFDETARALIVGLAVGSMGVLALLVVALWWLVGRLLRRVGAAAAREARFVADAAHELRAPLARMIAALEIDGSRSVDRALRDARGLAALTDDLLGLARLDAGAPLRRDPVDLDDVVWRAIEARPPLDRVISIEVRDVSAARVLGDRVLLERAITNLLDNAQRHARTYVALALRQLGEVVELRVADDGEGFSPEVADRAFDRFVRDDDARTPGTGGTGLGLAIVRAVIEAHGGRVRIDSGKADGAELVVTLPSAERLTPSG